MKDGTNLKSTEDLKQEALDAGILVFNQAIVVNGDIYVEVLPWWDADVDCWLNPDLDNNFDMGPECRAATMLEF